MTAHTLAKLLLSMPDVPVVTQGVANLLYEIDKPELITDIIVGTGEKEQPCIIIQ